MHELSIVQGLVDVVNASLPSTGVRRVTAVRLRLGALSGVVRDALEFCYDVGTAGTVLAGSRLDIEEQPVVVYCERCDADRTLDGLQHFACPTCGAPTPVLRHGRELEILSIEVEVDEDQDDDHAGARDPEGRPHEER